MSICSGRETQGQMLVRGAGRAEEWEGGTGRETRRGGGQRGRQGVEGEGVGQGGETSWYPSPLSLRLFRVVQHERRGRGEWPFTPLPPRRPPPHLAPLDLLAQRHLVLRLCTSPLLLLGPLAPHLAPLDLLAQGHLVLSLVQEVLQPLLQLRGDRQRDTRSAHAQHTLSTRSASMAQAQMLFMCVSSATHASL